MVYPLGSIFGWSSQRGVPMDGPIGWWIAELGLQGQEERANLVCAIKQIGTTGIIYPLGNIFGWSSHRGVPMDRPIGWWIAKLGLQGQEERANLVCAIKQIGTTSIIYPLGNRFGWTSQRGVAMDRPIGWWIAELGLQGQEERQIMFVQ